MTKRNQFGSEIESEKGQISIFFASSLIILITVIAFIVNIGVFVKAKINLQNATDAAAYAGASVQAQQLTRIAYLNWEMRNIYKEWMFKYYVLGNLNLKSVDQPPGSGNIKYTMEPDTDINDAVKAEDFYNFPSICIHFQSVASNVCKKYAVPGIPRFEATNMVGIDEATSAMIDSIVKTKAEDCTKRTELNFAVATTWAYGVPSDSANSFAAKAPQIAADRPGAWPKAVELAIRIRNLEWSVNKVPYTGGVCAKTDEAIGTCKEISEISRQPEYGNERVVKAFYSAFRNLGNSFDNEMKYSYKLTELAPKPYPAISPSLSTLLIPKDSVEKHYLDLKLMTLNYATFFTALISRDDTVAVNVQTQGACDVSKVGIPVPGYPLGFYKNPEVMTYYAVKGEAKFIGLFNPFKSSFIKLTAYAAAKPFGGRIGPALFIEKGTAQGAQGSGELVSRNDSNKWRSVAYISGLDISGTKVKGTSGFQDAGGVVPGEFSPGIPIPFNGGSGQKFWVEEVEDILGGRPQGNSELITYGIPNMIYDLVGDDFKTDDYAKTGFKTHIIKTAGTTPIKVGLYNSSQLKPFRQLLATGAIDSTNIKLAIQKARAPTRYESGNYLIPTTYDFMKGGYDTWGYVSAIPKDGISTFHMYAPLYSDKYDDVYYRSPSDVTNAISKYLGDLGNSVKKFRNSLNAAALSIAWPANVIDQALYQAAAAGISNISFADRNNFDQRPASCASINGKFLHFLMGGGASANPALQPISTADCTTIEPLITNISTYYSSGSIKDPGFDAEFYEFRYSDTPFALQDKLLSGYAPGVATGAEATGKFQAPFDSSQAENMKRNSYSSKFVSIKSLTASTDEFSYSGAQRVIYSEGDHVIGGELGSLKLSNTLDASLNQIQQ